MKTIWKALTAICGAALVLAVALAIWNPADHAVRRPEPPQSPPPPSETQPPAAPEETPGEDTDASRLQIQMGEQTFPVTLEDSESTRALLELLPLSVTMNEMNGNEKYTFLDGSLPTDSGNPGQIEAGDFMLYGDNCLVLFFKSFSTSYSYTRLGRVDDPEAFVSALDSGSVDVTLETDSEGGEQ